MANWQKKADKYEKKLEMLEAKENHAANTMSKRQPRIAGIGLDQIKKATAPVRSNISGVRKQRIYRVAGNDF